MQFFHHSRNVLLTLIGFQLFLSCSEKDSIRKIPSDANWVVYADFRQLALQAFSLSDLLKSKDRDGNKSIEKAISWENSGIDLISVATCFGMGENGSGEQKIVLLPISDREAFHNFCLEQFQMKEAAELGKDWLQGNNSFLHIREDLAFVFPGMLISDKESLLELVDKIVNLKEEDNLLNNSPGFKQIRGEGKSIGFWANLENTVDLSAMLVPSDLLNGEISGTADFRSGELVLDARIQQPDSVQSGGIMQNPLSKGMLEACLKNGSQSAFLAMRFSLPALRKLSEKTRYGQSGDLMLSAYGITTADLEKELSGEFAFMLSQNKATEAWPDFRILIGTSNSSGKLLGALAANGILQSGGAGNFSVPLLPGTSLKQQEKFIEISSAGWTDKKDDSKEKDQLFSMDEPAGMIGGIHFDGLSQVVPGSSESASAPVKQIAGFWRSMQFRLQVPDEANTRISLILKGRDEEKSSLITLLESIKAMNSGKKNKAADEESSAPVL